MYVVLRVQCKRICGQQPLFLVYRGLVKWYDRGLQNLWWEFDSLIPCYDRKLESLVKSRFFSFFVLSENINTKLDGRNRVCYIDFIKIIYVFLTIFLYLLKCPQSLIL